MLLDTWYIVMAFPPHCRVFLESERMYAYTWLPILLGEMADAEPAAHLTVGAITAQACCVQRQLQKGNCMTESSDLCKHIGSGPFTRWLRTDLAQLARKIQVCLLHWPLCWHGACGYSGCEVDPWLAEWGKGAGLYVLVCGMS